MKVYKFNCDSCGSKQYTKTKNGYKCKYCGSVQDVITKEDIKIETNDESKNEFIFKPGKDAGFADFMKKQAKKTLILLLICIFAGAYGIHKFIEHKIILGIVYIFTFGLFGIGLFIDVVKLAIKLSVELKASGGEQ